MTLQQYSTQYGLKTPFYYKQIEKKVTLTVKNKSSKLNIPVPFYFFGLKHCGKSTLGRLTAQALSMNFLDADDILSKFLSKKPGYESISIRELYRTKGKNIFQEY